MIVCYLIRRITKDPAIKLPPIFGEHQGKAKIKYSKEDFAKYIQDYIEENNFYPDYILGYSFGGAVAVTYHKLFNQQISLIQAPRAAN